MRYFKYLFFTTIAFCLVFFVATGIFWIKKTNKINTPTKEVVGNGSLAETVDKKESETIKIGGTTFEAEILDDGSERERGLSGRESLEREKVMFFVFEEETYPGIWMKDMAFPIDIAWIDKKGAIVHIEKNVSPKTFPKVFFPPAKSLYVLEANAGFFESHGLKVGSFVEI
jgi:uncharacterized membrane protein (UPF0127 family)